MIGTVKLIHDEDALSLLKDCALFRGMTAEDIRKCMDCCGAECTTYHKDEMIFTEDMTPSRLAILVTGTVRTGRDSIDGRRTIMTTFDQTGEIFGEVVLFLGKKQYGYFALAGEDTKIAFIPHYFMTNTCERNCGHHTQLISNMLTILARSAYSLNNRLEILSCQTLRQKIGKMLLLNCEGNYSRKLIMTREEMAQTLNVARPSLSRELMKMSKEGLIRVEGRKISVADVQALEALF